MDSDPDVFKQVLSELKSYLPVLAPLFFVYAIETRARLRIWHAVRVLPHLEKEPVEGDCEAQNGVSAEEAASIRDQKKFAKSLSRWAWIVRFVLSLMLVAIVLFEQTVYWRGWLNRSSLIVERDAESESQSGSSFGWYYHLISGQIEWPKAYYILTLFPPSLLALLLGPLPLLLGFGDRIIFRGADGRAFSFVGPKGRSVVRRRALRLIIFYLAAMLIISGALIFQNPICTAIFFASIVHFFVSDAVFRAVVVVGHTVRVILVLTAVAAILLWWHASSSTSYLPILLLRTIPSDDDTSWNWSGQIASAFVCGSSLNMISLSYRMDHTFARPEELLVDTSDGGLYKDTRTGAKLLGMRIPFCKRRTNSNQSVPLPPGRSCQFRRRPRWAKTYFRTSLLAWFLTYALVAYLKVRGYIATDAESATLYAFFLFPPTWAAAIMLRAALKGRNELGKVWAYKEDWVGRGEKVLVSREVPKLGKESAEKGKVLTSEEGGVEAKGEKLEGGKELVSEERYSEFEKGSMPVSVEQLYETKVVVEE